ncbi:MAG TPA: putative LPS assembly protein LptD [bacterium]|nr:putative LPS assembly protein LptD [bacterium]HPG44530.1 putative LPS assembly protein LptD [bacterium]HPM97088.1 putative LPS assembly protein LptD [bacterium]
MIGCLTKSAVLLLLAARLAWAQPVVGDSSKTEPPQVLRRSDLDTTLHYKAQTIHNSVSQRQTVLLGNAEVVYKNIKLQAGRIVVDWDGRELTAEGLVDSVWVYSQDHQDSTRVARISEEPVLIDGGTRMNGQRMMYNYASEKGRVVRGRTEIEDGTYFGAQIKKVGDKTFNVSQSVFTTCSLDSNPHYHFEARRLKMVVQEKVIAKPVVMYIGHIPIIALPFAVFPTERGRQSGIIAPTYGQSANEGRYLRGLGYYWAPSDYFDAKTTVDFYEKSGWLFRGGINYAVRYNLTGTISGSLTRKNFRSLYQPDYQERRWDLRVQHTQTIDPTFRIAASGYFVSDNSFYKDLSTNLAMRLTQELRSNMTVSKNWPNKKISLSANLSRTENLQNGNVTETLPQLTLRKSQTQLFKNAKSSAGSRQSRSTKWYESLYYSYSSNLTNTRRDYTIGSGQSAEQQTDRDLRINHNFNLFHNSPKKVFGWLSLNQNLNIDEDWFDKSNDYHYDPTAEQLKTTTVSGFAARHTFRYNASANTKIYGLFAPPIGDLNAIRHVVTPAISFNYQPDFSKDFWGYYQEIEKPDGQTIKQDRFSGTPRGEIKAINLSMQNLLQMKRGSGEKTKKIDLFTVNLNTGYNFAATSYRLSDLQSNWQANPAKNFSLSAGTTHSFYGWDKDSRSRVDRYLFSGDDLRSARLMRLTNLRLNFSWRLESKGEQPRSEADRVMTDPQAIMEALNQAETEAAAEEPGVLEENVREQGDRFQDESNISRLSIPWRLNLTFNFSLSQIDPNNPVRRYYLDISGAQVQLTEKWRIGYSAHLDLKEQKVSYQRFSIYRDLHCWEAQIDWVPSGISKRIYVRINIKAPMLQDIKLEKHGGTGSVLGY